ncbi:hypothetical protein CLIB1423_09S05358 [[Candida] railenensis]|uniref:Uncharacterized protein n=1 Tax=[Candida] railenensis TaxID=45579 RepID=A0A9P0VYP3_9ASCO|nr:hypothetical protein CLIB1423_09S05358 [[Candida] railenensis]
MLASAQVPKNTKELPAAAPRAVSRSHKNTTVYSILGPYSYRQTNTMLTRVPSFSKLCLYTSIRLSSSSTSIHLSPLFTSTFPSLILFIHTTYALLCTCAKLALIPPYCLLRTQLTTCSTQTHIYTHRNFSLFPSSKIVNLWIESELPSKETPEEEFLAQ